MHQWAYSIVEIITDDKENYMADANTTRPSSSNESLTLPDNKNTSMDWRKWEELDFDILIKLFSLLPKMELFVNVSSVCRSWRLGCWDMLFWRINKLDLTLLVGALEKFSLRFLDFSDILDYIFKSRRDMPLSFQEYKEYLKIINYRFKLGFENYKFSSTVISGFLRSIMEGNDANGICLDHWRLSIKTVIIPRYVDITDEHLQYIAERTPNLENLDLMEPFKITGRGFAEATCNWKHIQVLRLANVWSESLFIQILKGRAKNWPKLKRMVIHRSSPFFMSDASLRSDQVIKSLCTMKTLKFKGTYMSRGNMNMILDQCVELEFICIADSYLVGNYFRLYGGDELITPVSANIRFGENECKISGRPRKFEGGDAVSYFQRKYTHWEIGHPTLLSSRHYLACGDFCITFGW